MSKHLKRLATPRSWTIHRKTNVYTTKPSPGPHPIERAVPLSTLLRDYMGLAATRHEAKGAIHAGDVLVDGRTVADHKLPVGFMDALSIPKLEKAWRVVIDHHGRLRLAEDDPKNAGWKLVQINGKTTIKGGKTQLNLHDGRNLIVKKDDYGTGDVLKLEVPGQKVIGHFPYKEGATVLVTGGQHAGEIAPVEEMVVTRSHKPNLVRLKKGDGSFTTMKPYAFPIGDEKNLPKAEVKSIV